MSKRTYSSPTPGHPKRFMKMPRAEKQQPRTVLPELPSTVGLLLSLKVHTRREWVTTPIQAPDAPCWANAALSVFQDVCAAYADARR